MSCTRLTIGGVSAILCRRTKPPRLHYRAGAGQVLRLTGEAKEQALCGHLAQNFTDHAHRVTCRRCRKVMANMSPLSLPPPTYGAES